MTIAQQMKPGRELDALIAIEVMGWTRVRRRPLPHGSKYGRARDFTGRRGEFSKRLRLVPRYSQSVGAAWEIVERLMQTAAHVQVHADHEGSGCIVLLTDGSEIDASTPDKNAAHAICLAALAVHEASI